MRFGINESPTVAKYRIQIKKIQIENVKEKVEHIECEWILNEDIIQL